MLEQWKMLPLIPSANVENIDFENILNASQEWLLSKEFNEKYIKTNHPYPPLLNPQLLKDENSSIHYQNIPADFAWQSNLPLPSGYKFLFLMMSHSGHSSMVRYLKQCGVSIMGDHDGVIPKHYQFNYNALLKKEPTVINFTAYGTMGEDYYEDLYKYIHLINPKIPVLCLVRDPVARLKTSLNNHFGKSNIRYFFKENDDLTGLENRFVYPISQKYAFKDRVEAGLTAANTFKYSELYQKMLALGFNNFEFLDIQKITEPKDIFDLMAKLSKTYDFPPPKNIDDFNFRIKRSYLGMFPLLYEIGGITFLLTPNKWQKIENNKMFGMNLQYIERLLYELHESAFVSSNEKEEFEASKMLGLDLSWFNEFESGIYIYAKKECFENIYKNIELIKQRMNIFINKIKEVMSIEKQRRMTNELELLEFFKTHPRHRQLFKIVIQKEIELVKTHRPDIVQTWHYYLEFEKLCQQFNSNT